ADGEVGREQADRPPERPGYEAERHALDAGEREQMPARGAARAKERERAPVAVDAPERGEVDEPERDQSTGDGEHDVERLCVEGVAGRRREPLAEVVDEADPSEQRPLDRVADLRRTGQRVRR